MDATLRARNQAAAIFLPAVLVINWAVILGRPHSRKHFASVLVMQNIRK
jgi:hypothetical protein